MRRRRKGQMARVRLLSELARCIVHIHGGELWKVAATDYACNRVSGSRRAKTYGKPDCFTLKH